MRAYAVRPNETERAGTSAIDLPLLKAGSRVRTHKVGGEA
jgi:hypothetical protein